MRVAAICGGLLATMGSARSAGVEVISLSYDSVITSPCNGEAIRFVGEVELRMNTVSTPSGRTRTIASISYHDLTAVGLDSGTVYDVTGAYHDGYGQGGGLANGETYVNRFNFIAPGAGGNVFYDELLHVTVNAAGETVVTQDPFTLECR